VARQHAEEVFEGFTVSQRSGDVQEPFHRFVLMFDDGRSQLLGQPRPIRVRRRPRGRRATVLGIAPGEWRRPDRGPDDDERAAGPIGVVIRRFG
jgi:hypothetical protein